MVLRKRQDYGFNGYCVPAIPRAPRSVRRKASQKKAVVDSQLCAFELLAAVAGKLLQESESSASSNAADGKDELGTCRDGIKLEQQEDGKSLKSEFLDVGSCAESIVVSELQSQERNLKATLKEFTNADSESGAGHTSIITSYDFPCKVGSAVKSENFENKNVVGNFPVVDNNINNGIELDLEVNKKEARDLSAANICKDPLDSCVNTCAFLNSDSSVQFSSYKVPVRNDSFLRNRKDVKLGISDDDENSVRHNQPNTKIRAFKPRSHSGYRRIRKLFASKYRKAAPKLKDCELSNNDGGMKPMHRGRKNLLTYERYQHETPFKKRKLCPRISTAAYDQEASSESISNVPEKGMNGGKSISPTTLQRVPSSVSGRPESFQSGVSHVKLSIKSFKVPELYIEVPETSTVGSLKRTILEAVTAILSEGIHVGVLLQGKKIRDDNRTLQQSGISRNDNLDSLGFTLEPSSAQASPLCAEKPQVVLHFDEHQEITRSPVANPIMGSEFSNESFDLPPVTNSDNLIENKYESVPSSTAASIDGVVPDSRALVAIPALSAEALAMIPMNQKTRRSELGQRRTRRPFSVSEVEALVEAVETLGTGRWRDVKLRAFDDADHRTYVDLKDKWKTLVHTASISPQQRRGEPVPQELLDRVLSAHAYWFQHQSKQHSKHQVEPLKFLEPQVGGVAA